MPIDNMFLHFNNDATFQDLKSEIKELSITFVKDSGKIYTHEKEYNTVNWGSDSLSNFIIAETEADFQNLVDSGSILNEAIAFMSDTKRVWTHGMWFATTLDADAIQEIINNSETLQEFLNSLSVGVIDITSFSEASGTLTGELLSELEEIAQKEVIVLKSGTTVVPCVFSINDTTITIDISQAKSDSSDITVNTQSITITRATGEYTSVEDSIVLQKSGTGARYLADDGEYKSLPDVATVVELNSSVLYLSNDSTSEDIIAAFDSEADFTSLIEQIRDSDNIINEVFVDTDDYIGHLNASIVVSKTQEQVIVRFVTTDNILVVLVITNTDGIFTCLRVEYSLGSSGGVEEAPIDGNAYIRKDGAWIEHQEDEVYVGTTEPTVDCDIWVNPEDGTVHVKNSEGIWVEVSGSTSTSVETLKVNLTSNLTNPNLDLNGVQVTVSYGDINESQSWAGDELTFTIPQDQSYQVSVSSVTDYATPATLSFTAIANNDRSVTFTYNTTVVSVTVSGVNSCTATVTGSSTSSLTFSEGNLTQSFRVPTGDAYTVTFSEVSGYSTPDTISSTASGATQSHNAEYGSTVVTVNVSSNQSDFNESVTISISYTGGSDSQQVTGAGSVSFSIPYGTSYTITFNEITGYRTPSTISDTANASTKSHSVSYDATIITVNLTSNHGTTDLGSATATINNTAYSNGQTVRIATGTSITTTFSEITGYKTPSSLSTTASGTSLTITGTYQSEWVTVSVTGISSGFTITISDGFSAAQTSTSQVHKIPYDTNYTVSASAVSGYSSPSDQSFTASLDSRTVTMAYTEITDGVFVLGTDGSLTEYNSWSSSVSTAVGVALITDNVRFAIKSGLSAMNNISWSNDLYGTDIEGLTNYTSSTDAITDYDGYSNTLIINAAAPDESTSENSANYCLALTMVINGDTIYGYLPSAGELAEMYNNKEAIDAALEKIGSTTISDVESSTSYRLWSSTEYSSDDARRLLWSYSSLTLYTSNKDFSTSYLYALPVFKID